MNKQEIEAYKNVREIAVKLTTGQLIPNNWRKILTYADEVMSCGEFTTNEDHKHVYHCDIDSPISGIPVCNCGETYKYSVKDEIGLMEQSSTESESFNKQLSILLNKFSLENTSNTPDFMLAEYLIDCLVAYNKISVWNYKWHSVDGVPKNERDEGPCLDRPYSSKTKYKEAQEICDFLDRK